MTCRSDRLMGALLPSVIHNVWDYGAVGNGDADDTLAIKLAIQTCGDGVLFFPSGDYRITGEITIPFSSSGIRIEGASQRSANIIQDVDDTPIFHFTDSGSFLWTVRNLSLKWSRPQRGMRASRAFAFSNGGPHPDGWGHHTWVVESVSLNNGFEGFGQTDSGVLNPIWGGVIRNLMVEKQWFGPVVHFENDGSGQPNLYMENLWVNPVNVPTEEFLFEFVNCSMLTVRSVNIGNWDGANEMLLKTCLPARIENYKTEAGVLTEGGATFWARNSTVTMAGIGLNGVTFDVAGWHYLCKASGESSVDLRNVVTKGNTYQSGSFALVSAVDPAVVLLSSVRSDASTLLDPDNGANVTMGWDSGQQA